MPDMLVKLYQLPPLAPLLEAQSAQGVTVRRGLAPESSLVCNWVNEHFNIHWVSETSVAFTREPVSCFIAIEDSALLGFACYDATLRGYFGPMGVMEVQRGRGIGKTLLLACLHAMWQVGYGYAIIGAAGPTEFYAHSVGATIIPESVPGIWRGMLRGD